MDADGPDLEEATSGPEWDALASALRRRYLQDPLPETERRHLATMLAAHPRRRRRRRHLAVAATVGAVTLMGGATLAAAGELPAPVQARVAALAERVHISLPEPPPPGPPVTGPPGPAPGPGPGPASTTPAGPGPSSSPTTPPTTASRGRAWDRITPRRATTTSAPTHPAMPTPRTATVPGRR